MTPTSDLTSASTRRQLLRTGAIGAAAAAFLAACGTNDDRPAGQSGMDPTPSAVPPTLPPEEPDQDSLTYDLTMLRTAASLELVVAQAYTDYGPELVDPEWVASAERFRADHETLAQQFNDAIKLPKERIDEPNLWVQENVIDPVVGLLNDPGSVSDMFAGLESMLAATYLAAVQTATSTEWRSNYANIAAGAARRNALLGHQGDGKAPTGALYPSTDLVSNDAYLPVDAASGEGES